MKVIKDCRTEPGGDAPIQSKLDACREAMAGVQQGRIAEVENSLVKSINVQMQNRRKTYVSCPPPPTRAQAFSVLGGKSSPPSCCGVIHSGLSVAVLPSI